MTAAGDGRLVIRSAVAADRPVIDALQHHLPSPAPALVSLAFDGPATVLVAERDAVVVGYALALPGRGEAPGGIETEPTMADPDAVYLAELVVVPEERREGVGSRLLDAVDSRVGGADQLRLTAGADDERALAFYRSEGFRRVRELPGHYGDEDGVLLARDVRK